MREICRINKMATLVSYLEPDPKVTVSLVSELRTLLAPHLDSDRVEVLCNWVSNDKIAINFNTKTLAIALIMYDKKITPKQAMSLVLKTKNTQMVERVALLYKEYIENKI